MPDSHYTQQPISSVYMVSVLMLFIQCCVLLKFKRTDSRSSMPEDTYMADNQYTRWAPWDTVLQFLWNHCSWDD